MGRKVGGEVWNAMLEKQVGREVAGKVGREGLKGRLEGKVAGKVDRAGSRKGGSQEVVARRWAGRGGGG